MCLMEVAQYNPLFFTAEPLLHVAKEVQALVSQGRRWEMGMKLKRREEWEETRVGREV